MIARSLVPAALTANLFGCFNSSSYVPILSFVVAADSGGVQSGAVVTGTARVFVIGFYLSPGATVYWNGRKQKTTYLGTSAPGLNPQLVYKDARVLQADLDIEATKIAGSIDVTVANDNGLLSRPLTVYIVDASLTLTAIAPQQVAVGAAATTLTLTGTGFNPSSQVLWNGSVLQTTFVTSTSITALVPASLLTVVGDQLVQISQTICDGYACRPFSVAIVCSVGISTRHTLQQNARDIVWDATHSLLFASIYQSGSSRSITAINPVSAALGASVTTASAPQLSISDQDQFLYVESQGLQAPVRYALPGLTGPTSISAAGSSYSVVLAAPGAPATAAFFDFSYLGVVDGTVARTKLASSYNVRSLAWGFDASKLYGISAFSPGVLVFSVDQSGVTRGSVPLGSTPFPSGATIYFDRISRRLYASSGENLDEQGGDPHPFPVGTSPNIFNTCQATIDGALGKAFFACNESLYGLTVRSFDLQSQQQISRIILVSNNAPEASRIVRWGSDGLAVATGWGIYLYSGPFVH
jgi:hypothetical protein